MAHLGQSKTSKYRAFRCPECWRGYHKAEHVVSHREHHGGKCFDRLSRSEKAKIIAYRNANNITPPPLPDDPDDFEILE